MEHLPTVIWFKDCNSFPLSAVGEKGIDLGKLEATQLPIPPGFVIPAQIFSNILTERYRTQIEELFSQIEDSHSGKLNQVAFQLQRLIEHIEVPHEIAQQIAEAYERLSNNSFVAIRSSKTQARLPNIHATYLNIQGDANVIDHVKKTWGQLFQPKILRNLFENLISPTEVSQAVVVQHMTQSKVAGVAYSKNPDNQNKRTVVIEAIWGLGEYLKGNLAQADRYEIEKDSWEIVQQQRHAQDKELIRKIGTTQEVHIPDTRKFSPKLNSNELKRLAQIAVKIQQFLFFPQHIEWSLENDQFFILQTQQLMEKIPPHSNSENTQIGTMRALLYGSSVHPGLISGKVKICHDYHAYDHLEPGEILVTERLDLQHLDQLRKAAAIITDQPLFPRDVQNLGVPCVGNTHFATHTLKNGQSVTVHGQQGVIYEGALQFSHQQDNTHLATPSFHTKLYLATGEPETIHRVNIEELAGVGVLRAEYMVAQIGLHPKQAIHEHKEHLFVHRLTEDIKTVCQTVHPKPVYYRLLNMTSQELSMLKGGEEFETPESNPLIGYRGAFRYLTDTASLDLELEAIRALKREGYDNLHILLPFVRSLEEFILLRAHLEKRDLPQSPHFQIWLMINTPAVALELESYLSHGVDGVTIHSKDLKMLLSGIDPRVSSELGRSYDRSPSFKTIMKMIIDAAKKYQRPVIFNGPVLNQELVEFLVHEQVTGLSVNATQIPYVQRMLEES